MKTLRQLLIEIQPPLSYSNPAIDAVKKWLTQKQQQNNTSLQWKFLIDELLEELNQ